MLKFARFLQKVLNRCAYEDCLRNKENFAVRNVRFTVDMSSI